MTELHALRTFFRFNATVRRRYLATILGLPGPEQSKDRGASYPSLLEIFGHTLDGLRLWVAFLQTGTVSDFQALDVRNQSPVELAKSTEQVEELTSAYLSALKESDLEREVVLDFGAPNAARTKFTVGDLLWHIVEEELQHRGELNALLWQMDIEPPLGVKEDWAAAKEFVRSKSS